MDYLDFLRSTNGESTLNVFEFIQKNLLYDVNLIWDNLLRTMNLADLHNVMHLTYILPSSISNPNYLNKKKIALLIHIFFEDLIDECYAYAQSIPEQSDVYITTNNEEKKEEILKKFKNLKCNNLFVSVIDNRGRDINALLIAPKQFIMDYDYVCFVHSKKSSHMAAITGASWRYKCFENLLKSRQFVENVISTFEENPRLGILVPPHPSHGDYYSTLGVGEWLGNYKNVSELAKILDIHLDIDPEKEPIAPLGSMFWFRPSALKALYNYDWKVSDFPEGNMATDGTLSHAIERIHPFVAQQAGYYSAYIMSDHYARIEDTNLYYMLRKLNKTLFNIYGLNSYYGLLNTIEHFSKKSQNSKNSRFSRFIRKFINIFESTISIFRY
jgi:rhamnosyltransferase